MTLKRVSSGVPGLDEIISGGFPEGSLILVSGSPGTGKTTVGLQFLYQGTKNNENGVYVSFDEPKKSVINYGREYGMDFEELEKNKKICFIEYTKIGNELYLEEINRLNREIEDLIRKRVLLGEKGEKDDEINSRIAANTKRIKEIECLLCGFSAPVSQNHREQIFFDIIQKAVVVSGATRMVIDSLSSYMLHDSSRSQLHWFIQKIRSLGVTTLIISEVVPDDRKAPESVAEYLVDGVIVLKADQVMDMRSLQVKKMRGTHHTLKPQTVVFEADGLKIKK